MLEKNHSPQFRLNKLGFVGYMSWFIKKAQWKSTLEDKLPDQGSNLCPFYTQGWSLWPETEVNANVDFSDVGQKAVSSLLCIKFPPLEIHGYQDLTNSQDKNYYSS